VKAAIDEALRCRETGDAKTILFNNSGHGNFDFSSYEAYFAGKLVDYEYPAELIKESLARLPVTG
jgi:tryptophan synthase beta chain